MNMLGSALSLVVGLGLIVVGLLVGGVISVPSGAVIATATVAGPTVAPTRPAPTVTAVRTPPSGGAPAPVGTPTPDEHQH